MPPRRERDVQSGTDAIQRLIHLYRHVIDNKHFDRLNEIFA